MTLRLAKDLGRALRLGHPWIYDRALAPGPARLEPGQVVEVADRRGRAVARGFADPTSPIRVRVLSLDPAEDIGAGFAAARTARAAALRRADAHLEGTDAIRLVHGEGDLMPGLVVDLYGSTAVALTDGAGAAAFWTGRIPAVVDAARAAGFQIDRVWLKGRRGPGRALLGDEPPPQVTVHEDGLRFEVDVRHGQKTGLFLDQRENRRYLGALVRGRRVLNLFGYTGGFSLHADRGGAAHVVTVDQARPAIEAARRNLAASGLDPDRHELVAADAFAWLEAAAAGGRRFEVVVCDPPSFAPRADAGPAARAAYRRLNALALAVVAPGGLLLTASCSSHITAADLREAVAAAALDARRPVLVRGARGAASDHPVLPAFPEGDYLKLLDLHVG
ncbi:MAG TPA: class I SAM-dependent rRNA methyltransferase [Kofleriaceae bacterium]|nr:class I SAM-dependent rRNA methyltransferase [Kofleriaceae bacterium]